MKAYVSAERVRIEGRTLSFRVKARDETELIGDGGHDRLIVSVARLNLRAQPKVEAS